jgi:2-C-methyl-D-erythritol 4-phosphate cytidylyltransferase
MKKYLIVVAGGKGLRMGQLIPKQFMLLCGRPILFHTLEAFHNYDPSIEIIIVLPEDQKTYWSELCDSYSFFISHQIATGGETRFDSVKNGLEKIPEGVLIAVHDGVRPLITRDVIERVFAEAEEKKAAYPVIPVTDSLRRYIENGDSMSVDRSKYCLVQTPQIFHSSLLKEAYNQNYQETFTDDISVVEAMDGCVPVMVEGSKKNLKITTSFDLVLAESLIKCKI